jgi:hypothetical protein
MKSVNVFKWMFASKNMQICVREREHSFLLNEVALIPRLPRPESAVSLPNLSKLRKGSYERKYN